MLSMEIIRMTTDGYSFIHEWLLLTQLYQLLMIQQRSWSTRRSDRNNNSSTKVYYMFEIDADADISDICVGLKKNKNNNK